MSTAHTDLRPRRTELAIQKAFAELIEEKGFEAMTVGDLADRAMINRATFYKHYRDKYQLVERIFEEVIEEVRVEVRPTGAPLTGRKDLEPLLGRNSAPALRIFEHFAKNARLYRAILGSDGSAWFQARLRDYFATFNVDTLRLIDRTFPAQPGFEKERPSPDIVAVLIANFLVASLGWWLEGDMRYSPSQMVTWLGRFVLTGFIGWHPDLKGQDGSGVDGGRGETIQGDQDA